MLAGRAYLDWCGHGQEVIPVPREDGLVAS